MNTLGDFHHQTGLQLPNSNLFSIYQICQLNQGIPRQLTQPTGILQIICLCRFWP
jgi:hypothetical protein